MQIYRGKRGDLAIRIQIRIDKSQPNIRNQSTRNHQFDNYIIQLELPGVEQHKRV